MSIDFSRTGPPVSPTRLADVVGSHVPGDYRDFMLRQNGGVLSSTARLADDASGASVSAFLIVDDPEGKNGYDLALHVATYRGRYPERFLPIGVDVSSNLILLDIGGGRPGSVWFWDHEGEASDGEPAREDNIEELAGDFSSFVAALTTGRTEEEQVQIEQLAGRARVWVDPDFSPEFD